MPEDTPTPKRVFTEEQLAKRRACNKARYYQKREEILAAQSEYRKNNKEKEATRARRYRHMNKEKCELTRIKRVFGLLPDVYLGMVEGQKGKCFICGHTEDRLHIDHCHKTGFVRKLLCHRCNIALGLFQDDPSVVYSAAKYLEDHKHE
jgi:hypothetical protein